MSKRKTGQRTKAGRLSRSKLALAERNPPSNRIMERRGLFAFVTPSKGPDGRVGEIDQDICDGIGQLHAVGLLDGHGLDPQDMRDKARLYAELYWVRFGNVGPRTGKLEPSSRSTNFIHGLEPKQDALFLRMDDALEGFGRDALLSLIVDRAWGDEIVPWASRLIAEGLRERRIPAIGFPTCEDRAMLQACIRGLCAIVDGGLEMRRAA